MVDMPAPTTPRDGHGVLEAARDWLAEDGAVAIATVVDTWGSAPVPIGGQMAVAKDGRFQGSVSGGCIEGDVIVEAEEIIESGKPKLLEFGVADETAWRAGLPCGGKVKVYVERVEAEGRWAGARRACGRCATQAARIGDRDAAGGWLEDCLCARGRQRSRRRRRRASRPPRAASRRRRRARCSCTRWCRRRAFWSSARRTSGRCSRKSASFRAMKCR